MPTYSAGTVYHIRLPQFLVQAERRIDTTLATKPIGIIASRQPNAPLLTLSPEAVQEGLTVGMPRSLAAQISPRTVLLPAHYPVYQKANTAIYEVLSAYCPVVEPARYGQFYLDMQGMRRMYTSNHQAGYRIVNSITDKVAMRSQVGISTNKLVSWVTTKVVPDTLYTVEAGTEPNFLSPLDSRHLPVTRQNAVQTVLHDFEMPLIRDMQILSGDLYRSRVIFGDYARTVHHQSRGIDTSAVKSREQRDHIVERQVLPAPTNDADQIRGMIQLLAVQIGFQLRQQGRTSKKVVLTIHYTDGYESNGTSALPRPTDSEITRILWELCERANTRRNRIRSVTADVSQFVPRAEQMALFESRSSRRDHALSGALDRLRSRYGFDAIRPAVCLV